MRSVLLRLSFATGALLFSVGCGFIWSGPDECSSVGETWCSGDTVRECRRGGDENHAGGGNRTRELENCAELGGTCVQRIPIDDPDQRGFATCVVPCDLENPISCASEGVWQACVPAESTPEAIDAYVAAYLADQTTPQPDADGAITRVMSTIVCSPCQTPCQCPAGETCIAGNCEIGTDDVLCCNRERGRECPPETECMSSGGDTRICSLGDVCDECDADNDCGVGECVFLSNGDRVCANQEEVDAFVRQMVCISDTDIGYADFCGVEQRREQCVGGSLCMAGECVAQLPAIEVAAEVDFGSVTIGETGSTMLEIRNTGASELEVTNASVVDSVFAVNPTAMDIEAGATGSLQLFFSPQFVGALSTTLSFETNVGASPVVEVVLRGTGQ